MFFFFVYSLVTSSNMLCMGLCYSFIPARTFLVFSSVCFQVFCILWLLMPQNFLLCSSQFMRWQFKSLNRSSVTWASSVHHCSLQLTCFLHYHWRDLELSIIRVTSYDVRGWFSTMRNSGQLIIWKGCDLGPSLSHTDWLLLFAVWFLVHLSLHCGGAPTCIIRSART